jgi:glutamine amidotransferase
MGNLASVYNAFKKIGFEAKIINNSSEISKYDKIVLPGVGAFKDAMDHLKEFNFIDEIKKHVEKEKPLLGICLGMQLLFKSSEEFGQNDGLGLINGQVVKFNIPNSDLKIPHMGWNQISWKKDSILCKGLSQSTYLYFVHSYHAQCEDSYAIGKTHYGYNFVSAVEHNNIFGFQPHPEKSHESGLKILKNYAEF